MPLHRIKYKDIEQLPSIQIKKDFKKDFQGSSPSLFVGRYGYPNLNVGLLSPQFSGDTSYYDSPKLWSQGKFNINSIATLRYGLVNSRAKLNIKPQNSRFLELCQDVAQSSKPVELEVNLKNKPIPIQEPDSFISPFGPQSEILKANLTANPKIDTRVQRVTSDTDLKAVPAITNLYQKGFEESFLSKLLSSSSIGLKANRKLVPTRWSITAVDDTLGKDLLTEIKQMPEGNFQAYFGGGWGNYYLFLFFSTVWSFELFETYLNKTINPWSKEGHSYSTDYEPYNGRTTYAEECAGGYYACRLPILEKMKELKHQHSCLAFRFITEEYNVPLGVWVCREASRRSLKEPPLSFSSPELLLSYAKEFTQRKFSFDLSLLLKESRLLKDREQKKISDFAALS
jgi:hypothetical protein